MRGLLLCGIVAAPLVCSGCATTGDVSSVNYRVDKIERQLDEVLAEARAARIQAEDANTRAKRTEEMLNRSFKRSMYK